MKTIIENKIKKLKEVSNTFGQNLFDREIGLLQSILEEAAKTKEDKEETVYKVGQRILIKVYGNRYLCIISQVERDKVAAIGLEDGNRWNNPIIVGNIKAITEQEMLVITNKKEFCLK